MRKLFFFTIGLILYSMSSFAQIESAQTGNWSSGSTWVGGNVPGSSDAVVIKEGHIVTVESSQNCKYFTVKATSNSNYGELRINSGGVLTTSGNSTVYGILSINGGALHAGNSKGDKLTINANSASDICKIDISEGTLDLAGYFALSNSATFIMSGGNINVYVGSGTISSSTNVFNIPSGSFFTMSGGAITFSNYNSGSGADFKYTPSTSNVTGGEIIFNNNHSYKMIATDTLHNITCNIGSGNTLTINNMPSSPDGFVCNDFTITSGTVQIAPKYGMTVNGTLSNSGTLLIKSDNTGSGSLITNNSNVSINVERYISAWTNAAHGWHFLSSPVANQAIRPEFVPNPPTINEDFYKWDESLSTNNWINTKDNSGGWNSNFEDNFVVGRGYLVAYASDVTKTFSGSANIQDVDFTDLSYTASSPYTGWHLLGNPFQSALLWDNNNSAVDWNLSNVDGTLKIWNEANASYTDVGDGGYIPPLNGFMVHVTSGTNSIKIPEAGRRHKSTAGWLKNTKTDTTNLLLLKVVDMDGQTAQENKILIKEDATTDYDPLYDSYFLPGYAPQFYAISGEDRLSTIALPELTTRNDIFYGFIKNNANHFYFQMEDIETLTPMENVYLTDLLTNHTQLLNENPIYEFTAGEDDPEIRFKLHFAPLGLNENIDIKLFTIFSVGNRIEVRSDHMVNAQVKVYNITGQLVNTAVLNNQTSLSLDVNVPQGVYIVSVISNGKIQTQKVILN